MKLNSGNRTYFAEFCIRRRQFDYPVCNKLQFKGVMHVGVGGERKNDTGKPFRTNLIGLLMSMYRISLVTVQQSIIITQEDTHTLYPWPEISPCKSRPRAPCRWGCWKCVQTRWQSSSPIAAAWPWSLRGHSASGTGWSRRLLKITQEEVMQDMWLVAW